MIDAHELGALAVAIARVPGSATVTIRAGRDGGERAERPRGRRLCRVVRERLYRAKAADGPVRVTVDGEATTFDTPVRAPDARQLLRR